MAFEFQPGSMFGEYTLDRRIGGGGFGDVWLSRDAVGDAVAVKILHGQYQSSEAARLRGEIELLAAAASSRSEHIVHVLDGGSEPTPHVVMEYIDGTDLGRELTKRGSLPVNEVLKIAEGIAEALIALRYAGIIHRDIKPANVMIDSSGVVKLTDFGIAKIVGVNGITTANHLAMTVAYAAPEAFEGKVSYLSDHYAFGALLYQLLTGKTLVSGSYVEMMRQHVLILPDFIALPPDVPPSLHRLIEACLAKIAADRPSRATELQAAIFKAQDEFDATRPRASLPLPDASVMTQSAPRAARPEARSNAPASSANVQRPRAVINPPTQIAPGTQPAPSGTGKHPMRIAIFGALAGLALAAVLGAAYAFGRGTHSERDEKHSSTSATVPIATPVNLPPNGLVPQVPTFAPIAPLPGSPEQTVRQYYTFIGAKDFPNAFNLLSTRFRAGTGVDTWRQGYQTTQAVSVQSSQLLSGTTDQVEVRFTATDLKNGILSTSAYSGIWTLVQEAGGWKLDHSLVSVMPLNGTPGGVDLVVSRISVLPDGRVAVTVGNRGPASLSGKPIFVSIRDLTLRGEQLSTQVASLPVGATVTLTSTTFKIDRETDVQAIVDPFGSLNDPDRSNNQTNATLAPVR